MTHLHLIAAEVILEDGGDERLLVDLAHGVAGDALDEAQDLGDLVVGKAVAEGAAHVHGLPALGLVGVMQDDDGADLLAPFARGHGQDGGLGHLGQGQELALHLEGRDLLAARLNDVGRLAAQDEVHGAPGPVAGGAGARTLRDDGAPQRNVARLEPAAAAVLALDELIGRRLGVAPVLTEDVSAAQLDLAAVLAAAVGRVLGDDLVGLGVDEAGLDAR